MEKQPATRASTYGKRNAYQCDHCKGWVVTLDLEEGVTPFSMPCLAIEGCTGFMQSACYRGPLGGKTPEAVVRPHYHWRKPTPEEYQSMGPGSRQHVDQGGLEIYPVPPIDLRKLPPRALR